MQASFAAGFCALLLIGSGVARAQTATIDGFTVSSLPPPTIPAIPVATSDTLDSHNELSQDNVLYLTGSYGYAGASPYAGALMNHAAYLSIQENGKADFAFPKPAYSLSILWGTIGPVDSAVFYSGSSQVGALSGADLAAVYGNNSAYLSITSQVPFTRVVLQEGASCCFEFSNLSAQ